MWSRFRSDPEERRDRAIALAAILRAALLVQDSARQGMQNGEASTQTIRSILAMDGNGGIQLFGDISGLRRALALICPLLQRGPGNAQEAELLRYALALLTLGKRLIARHDLAERVRQGIEQAQRQMEHFADPLHPSVTASLAQTYTDAVGKLSPRIIVSGESRYLSNNEDAARIRTLLLAGIRAAVWWRQRGGNLLRLILERRALCQEATALLAANPFNADA